MAKSTLTVRTVKASARKTARRNRETRAVERRRVRKRAEAPAALKFGRGNAKLDRAILTFSLPAGWSCPGARDCSAKAAREGGAVSDAARIAFRCFAASEEARYPSVRAARWHNLDALRAA